MAFGGAGKASILPVVVLVVVLLDQVTKMLVEQHLYLYQQIPLVGDYLRLTFIYNPGAAFGIHLGAYSRVVFLGLSVIALVALVAMYWVTPRDDRTRLMAIALICGGAIGNLIDRVRSAQGVVDFVDLGIGDVRWPVFNVADVAVTTGAVFLALSLWNEEKRNADESG